MSGVLVTEVRSELGGLGSRWDALVDLAPLPAPFLRSWWLEATAGTDPRFVLVFDDEELIGGLALDGDRVAGVERLRVMGHGPNAPDQFDLVAAPDRVDGVLDALRTWFSRRGTRFFDLVGMWDTSRVQECLPGPVRRLVEDVAPWTHLPATFDEWLSQRSKSTRNKVRRARRRFEEQGAEIRRVGTDDLDDSLERLRSLHTEVFGGASLWLPGYEAFAQAARTGVARGELAIHEMILDGRVVGSETWFEYAGRISFWQGGRLTDPEFAGVGTALLSHGVASACERGFTELDFLRGGSDYKLRWTSEVRDVVRLRSAKGWRARVVAGAVSRTWRVRERIRQWRDDRRARGEQGE